MNYYEIHDHIYPTVEKINIKGTKILSRIYITGGIINIFLNE